MYAISAGILSGVSSPNIIHTNIVIGKLLSGLFLFSKKINWYTLYLQTAQLLSFLGIYFVFLNSKKHTSIFSGLIFFIIFFGFFSLSIVKVQFTTVALFCCFTALFSFQLKTQHANKICSIFFFITLSILIRKESFFILILFSIPFFLLKPKEKTLRSIFFPFICFVYIVSTYINNNNDEYKKQHTYNKFKALDIIAANPIKINKSALHLNKFTVEDIRLIQFWFAGDDAYLSDNKIELLAYKLKSYRNIKEVRIELQKIIIDERYLFLIYALTIIIILLFVKNAYQELILNALVFIFLLIYLGITYRLPHRVIFPIITYLILLNIFNFYKSETTNKVKTSVFLLLLILSLYKFYCTTKLFAIHKENHKIFNESISEINKNPNSLFIGLDGFPLKYMNAWQTADTNFPLHNLILYGWYACTPDYENVLNIQKIKNLTSDLKNKKDVLFLTDSEIFQETYIKVLKQRYGLDCHFETVKEKFKVLHPKRLVFDN